jgi:hypothetical protein
VGFEYLVIVFFFGLATGIIGKGKGSSFWVCIGAARLAAAGSTSHRGGGSSTAPRR